MSRFYIIIARVACVFCTLPVVTLATPASADVAPSVYAELNQTLIELTSNLQSYLIASPAGSVLGATSVTVSNDAELLQALSTVKGGETIALNPGTYSSVYIRGDIYGQIKVGTQTTKKALKPSSTVTITSADKSNKAVIKNIALVNTQNWRLDTLSFRPAAKVEAIEIRSDAVAVINNDISYGDDDNWSKEDWNRTTWMAINVPSGKNVQVEGNYMKNVRFGIAIGHDAPNAIVRNNTIDTFNGDAIRALGDNGLYEHNLVKNALQTDGNHSDALQSFRNYNNNKAVSGVTVRYNTFLNNRSHPLSSAMQGVGLFDGPYFNWIIENNLIVVDTYHGITVLGGVDSVVRNNVVVDMNTTAPGPARIGMVNTKTGTSSINSRIENNITTKLITGSTGVTYTDNKQITYADYGTYFVDHKKDNWAIKSGALSFSVGANQSGVASVPVVTTPTNPTPTTPTTPTSPTTPTPTPVTPPVVTPTTPTTVAAVSVTLAVPATVNRAAAYKVLGTQPVGAKGSYNPAQTTMVGDVAWVYVDFSDGVDGYVTLATLKSNGTDVKPVQPIKGDDTPATTPTTPTVSATYTVVLTDGVNVRKSPAGSILMTRKAGTKGTVDGNVAPITKGGYDWVLVDFESGPDGYVATSFLKKESSATSITTPTPTTTVSSVTRAEIEAKIAELLKQIAALQELLKKM